MANLPDWWPTWLPEACPDGHVLGPGRVSRSWVGCECPGASGGGHEVIYCATDKTFCRHHWIDPRHEGDLPEQRPD